MGIMTLVYNAFTVYNASGVFNGYKENCFRYQETYKGHATKLVTGKCTWVSLMGIINQVSLICIMIQVSLMGIMIQVSLMCKMTGVYNG